MVTANTSEVLQDPMTYAYMRLSRAFLQHTARRYGLRTGGKKEELVLSIVGHQHKLGRKPNEVHTEETATGSSYHPV